MQKIESGETKTFNIRIPKETWLFLKKTAIFQETSMADLIVRCVNKYKDKFNQALTLEDDDVQ